MNAPDPIAFLAAQIAADENIACPFRRAFAPTQLDRFREPDEPVSEWDGPDPDERYERERDNELEGL